jgi:leader peptidase (prepilin peptidase)/N-methyltransferase
LAVSGLILAPLYLHIGWLNSLSGAILGFAGLAACAFITETLTRKSALGGGDLWLTLGIGAWVGAGGLPMFMLALAATGIASVLAKRLRKARGQKITIFPFGPALAFAGWLAALYAPAYWHAIAAIIPNP